MMCRGHHRANQSFHLLITMFQARGPLASGCTVPFCDLALLFLYRIEKNFEVLKCLLCAKIDSKVKKNITGMMESPWFRTSRPSPIRPERRIRDLGNNSAKAPNYLLVHQLLVSCGGGRRLADGLRKQLVRTIRLLVWDTLEDFFATSDCT
jgi:hypothetical protein